MAQRPWANPPSPAVGPLDRSEAATTLLLWQVEGDPHLADALGKEHGSLLSLVSGVGLPAPSRGERRGGAAVPPASACPLPSPGGAGGTGAPPGVRVAPGDSSRDRPPGRRAPRGPLPEGASHGGLRGVGRPAPPGPARRPPVRAGRTPARGRRDRPGRPHHPGGTDLSRGGGEHVEPRAEGGDPRRSSRRAVRARRGVRGAPACGRRRDAPPLGRISRATGPAHERARPPGRTRGAPSVRPGRPDAVGQERVVTT